MLFFFHHYELPAILNQANQLEPEDDLLADPINLLTDEHNPPPIQQNNQPPSNQQEHNQQNNQPYNNQQEPNPQNNQPSLPDRSELNNMLPNGLVQNSLLPTGVTQNNALPNDVIQSCLHNGVASMEVSPSSIEVLQRGTLSESQSNIVLPNEMSNSSRDLQDTLASRDSNGTTTCCLLRHKHQGTISDSINSECL